MRRGKILIIDDDPIVRDVLAAIFACSHRYETESAMDGRAGIEQIRNHDYDLVFTDLIMPKMSGIDFIREAGKIRPSLPVVVITGQSTIDTAINAMREGAKDFITKPLTLSTVTSIADRIIGEKRLLEKVDKVGSNESFISRLNAELFKKLQKISMLQALSVELDVLNSNKDIYEKIVEMASRLLLVKEVAFGIVEKGNLKIRNTVGVPKRDIPIAGSVIERAVISGNHCLASFGEINPYTGQQITGPYLVIPFTINGEVFGIISLANKEDGTNFSDDELALALTFTKKATQRIENNALYEVFYNNLVNTLKSLVNSIEARNTYTRQHSERVTNYALRIAEAMSLGAAEHDALKFGGHLHDIGKIGVPDTILLKPDPLTPEERSEINLHPVIGGNIIKPLQFFPKERELILNHHEHFDGNGYPHRLSRTAIPITARILSVADAYDAMTSSRPYRQAKSHNHAAAELKRCSGRQFDGDVVRAFLQSPW